MNASFNIRRGTALLLAVLLTGLPSTAGTQERSGEQQLRQELDTVKEQLRRVEEQMKRQEELIRRLSGERPAAPPPAVAAPPAPPTVAPAVDRDVLRESIREELARSIQPQLAAANKTFPSQFNPAIGFIVDTVFSNSRQNKSNFEFRSGELGISASVDPFARAYAIINGTPDGVAVEEAAIVTTSLPWNLTVKGGRFFADFGRLSKFHDHDLPFVNRPIALDRFVGGESQSDGLEVSWLAPLPWYLTFTGGAYNKMGAANDRVDNKLSRDMSEFTYLGRVATFFSLDDANSIDLGVSDAYTPEVRIADKQSRNLFGVDLTYRYTPLASAAYRGLIWGTEFLWNRENRLAEAATEDTPAVFRYRNAFGGYSYVEARFTRRLYAGFLFEYVQDLDSPSRVTKAYSPYLTLWASEFQRLRLQYTRLEQPAPLKADDLFFLQWTIVMGSHVHSFRDR
jgi:hypothetical protein